MSLKSSKFFLIILLTVSVSVIAGCGRKEPPQEPSASTQAPAGHVGRQGRGGKSAEKHKDNVEHKVLSFNLEGLTDKGEKKWEVIGRTARSISENEIRMGNIVAKTYGDQEAVITADQGVYDKSKNNVMLEKNVVATIENAGSALKDQMGFSIDGTDPAKKAAQALPADKSKAKKKIVITCDGEVNFNYAKNLAFFKDNVKVRSEDGDIDADRITVNMDPATKKINDIVAEGHVKITQKGNTAYGDTAKYSETEKTVALTGSPKLEITQDANTVMKEKLTER